MVKPVPNILNLATKIDCPLNPFTHLKNIITNGIDISRFRLEAVYTQSMSPKCSPSN